ncbi:MAG: AmmeMemoRadiSam system protein B [Dehalococcoidales bacterium]
MNREATVSGMFYPGSPAELRKTISELIDKETVKEDAIGIIMPHAGYIYSGKVAGETISKVNIKNTCIILGPNHTGMGKQFSIMTDGIWKTPLGDVRIDSGLAKRILANSKFLTEDSRAHLSEHSIEVQLPFLQYFNDNVQIVPIILSGSTGTVYREIGHAIAKSIVDLKQDVLIVASSDMSHYEKQESAVMKDNMAIEPILILNEDELLNRIREKNISMCGFGPVVSLITAAKELGVKRAELVKYQTSGDITGDYSQVVGYAGIIFKKPIPQKMSEPAELAKNAVSAYIKEGKTIAPPHPLPPVFQGKAGVFVSVHKLGQLRGCIGTFNPSHQNIAQEIIVNAISAVTRDPRFSAVTADELPQLDYSVDILTAPEPVEDISELDPQKYGIIIEKGYRKGLLLPDLEGVNTVEEQIDITKEKAGISAHEKVKIYRFEVQRYK